MLFKVEVGSEEVIVEKCSNRYLVERGLKRLYQVDNGSGRDG